MQIIYSNQDFCLFPFCRSELLLILKDLLGFFELSSAPEVKLTDDKEIAQFNAKFLDLPGPTNVLSFPPAASDSTSLGFIVISMQALFRESFLYFQNPGEHMIRLLSHGMLHLAEYEHGPLMDDLTEKAIDRIVVLFPEQFKDMDIFY